MLLNLKNIYVGELVFPYDNNIEYSCTVLSGAYELDDTNIYKERKKSLFTVFLKMDNGKYMCLHNGKVYGRNTAIYIKDMSKFEQFLPKLDYCCYFLLSKRNVLSIFDKIVNNKRISYIHNKRDINRFWEGTIEICSKKVIVNDKYPYDKITCNMNVGETIPLEKLYLSEGKTNIINQEVCNFKIYKSLFYILMEGDLYNINNHLIYPQESENIILHRKLSDNLGEKYEDNGITIQKALKLQKKLK